MKCTECIRNVFE